jgi:hypothetical protein
MQPLSRTGDYLEIAWRSWWAGDWKGVSVETTATDSGSALLYSVGWQRIT